MTDYHEMRMVLGKVRAVYSDSSGREYVIIDGQRVYLAKEE